ncbi:hypothetical protein ACQP1U_08150 [Actinomycetota bacterium]
MSLGKIIAILVFLLVLAAVLGAMWANRQQRLFEEEGAGAFEKKDKDTIDWADPDEDVVAEGDYLGTTTKVTRRESAPVPGTGDPGPARITVRRKDSDQLITIERDDEQLVRITADQFRQVRKLTSPNPRRPAVLSLGWVSDDGTRCRSEIAFDEQADVEGLDAALWWHGSARAARDDFDYEEDQA